MTFMNFSKFYLFLFYISLAKKSAEAVTSYPSNNGVNAREPPQPVYSAVPQVYYVPYPKYISSPNQKYVVPQPENQIPVSVTSTEKALLSPTYKVALDVSKYVSQPSQASQLSYPDVYSLRKAVSSTAVPYTSVSSGAENYDEEPKKYHFGYRVSNPHSGTEFGHSEVNDGLTAKGYYHVLLPDGRLQNVKYRAGPTGYHATITYETQY